MRTATEITISRQVWVCDTCGCRDNKSCGCDSVAHAEELAAKREASRQADRRYREKKHQQNQRSRDNRATIENIEEFSEPEIDGDDDQTVWRRGLLFRARSATAGAEYENWSKFIVDQQLVQEAKAAAEAWERLARYLEEQHDKQATTAQATQDRPHLLRTRQ